MENSKTEKIIDSLKKQGRFRLIGEECYYNIDSKQNSEESSHVCYYNLSFDKKDLVNLIESPLSSKNKKGKDYVNGKYIIEYIVWEDACPMKEGEPETSYAGIRLSLNLNEKIPDFSAEYV